MNYKLIAFILFCIIFIKFIPVEDDIINEIPSNIVEYEGYAPKRVLTNTEADVSYKNYIDI